MQRHEALRHIQANIETVIHELAVLRDRIEPAMNDNGYGMFDVGVDLEDAATNLERFGPEIQPRDALGYKVIVYDAECRPNSAEVKQVVLGAVPKYLGGVLVTNGHEWYPANSVLNLTFLKDLHEASNGEKND